MPLPVEAIPGRDIAVIGAGPAGLMAAERLAGAGYRVDIYDRMPSPARKFLMAGRGGLNLTHSEPVETFMTRYGPAASWLEEPIARFSQADMRDWAGALGEDTFVGSSGRVFPKSFKASPLLRAWLARLSDLGVQLHTRHDWQGWSKGGSLMFSAPSGEIAATPAATILALGGASWPRLGSDGRWVSTLREQSEVRVVPLRAANAGVRIAWSEAMQRFAGAPVKRVALKVGNRVVRGEMVVTRSGLEGGAIYALSREIRALLDGPKKPVLQIDLRPDLGFADLTRRLSMDRGKQSTSTFLRKAAGLSPIAVALMRESGPLPMDAGLLSARIKQAEVLLLDLNGIDRAISSSGGIVRDELDQNLMLQRRPGVFVAGEMIDWEAPTGGYLLQACFATGYAAAEGVMTWLTTPGGQETGLRDVIS